ncbi:MAG: pentapeptide repeat-containing protein [Gemmataceae bacterium]
MSEHSTDRESSAGEEGASPAASIKYTKLTPAEALARLRSGRLLENVCVEKLAFTGEMPAQVRMKHCHLIKPRFESVTFKAEVQFQDCTIERPHMSHEVVFESDLSLQQSTLVGVQFTKITVRGKFIATGMQSRGQLAFLGCRFEGGVSFWDATFHNWVSFKRSVFVQEADFRSVHAHKGLSYADCRFEGTALFRGTAVTQKFDLGNSHVEKLLDLSRGKFNDYVYLEGISQGNDQQFAFENTIGERMLVTPAQLQGRLASEAQGHHAQAMQEYAYLKRSFASLHRYDEEDWAFYRFKVNQRRSRDRSWLRPWTRVAQFFDWCFLDMGCGYGANPMRAVRAALVIMLGFALVYMFWIEHFYIDEAKRPFPDQPLTSWANRIMVGTTVSVSVFTSGIGGIKELARDWMNIPLIVESLLGTLLWGLFIVSFSRKVIR